MCVRSQVFYKSFPYKRQKLSRFYYKVTSEELQIYVNFCSMECIVYNLAIHSSIYSKCKVWNYKVFFIRTIFLKCASSNQVNIECKDQNKRFILNTDLGDLSFLLNTVSFSPIMQVYYFSPHQLNLNFFQFCDDDVSTLIRSLLNSHVAHVRPRLIDSSETRFGPQHLSIQVRSRHIGCYEKIIYICV